MVVKFVFWENGVGRVFCRRASIFPCYGLSKFNVFFPTLQFAAIGGRRLAAALFVCHAAVLALAAQESSPKTSAAVTQASSVYSQGILALERGDLHAAQAAFEKVVRIAPNSPEGHNSLGWVLLAQEQTDPAIQQFHTALRLKPEFMQAHINLANALI